MSISPGRCGIAASVSILDCHLCVLPRSVVVYNFLQFALIVGMPTYLMAFAFLFALAAHKLQMSRVEDEEENKKRNRQTIVININKLFHLFFPHKLCCFSLGFLNLCVSVCVCILSGFLHNPNLWPKPWVDVCQMKYRKAFVMLKMKD